MAADPLQVTDDDKDAPVTREWVKLIMQSTRSEIRLLIGMSILGNQILSHVQIPSLAGYLGGGALLFGGVVKLIAVLR